MGLSGLTLAKQPFSSVFKSSNKWSKNWRGVCVDHLLSEETHSFSDLISTIKKAYIAKVPS